MIHITGIPGRTAEVDGAQYLFFSGFAYLGMPSIPAFQDSIREGILKYGAVFPSSRQSNTRLGLYDVFEERLADFTGSEAAASFSSGYLASQAAAAFSSLHTKLLYAPGIHPSLKTGGAVAIPAENWQQEILNLVNAPGAPSYTIVLESVNPLTGELHDLSWLPGLQRPVRILIDDSHGIGVLGERGRGISSFLPPVPSISYLVCCSLSKAFSCEGGAVMGAGGAIAAIKRLPHFTAATGMSPAFVYAWMESAALFLEQRAKLQELLGYFHQRAAAIPVLRHDPRLPVCHVRRPDLYAWCLEHRILLSAFRYPTDRDPLMVRMVFNALHTGTDVDRLADCIEGYRPQKIFGDGGFDLNS